MKKTILALSVIAGLASCGGFSEEQGKAAEEMCQCMENDTFGDFDINYYECDMQLQANYETEVFEDGSWLEAMEEKCPEVADKMD